MQELEATVFKYANLSNAGAFGRAEKVVTPIDLNGRVSVRFSYDGSIRTANVRAQDGWTVKVYEDGADIYVCSFDGGRNTVCVECFHSGDAPKSRSMTGAERATVLGAGFGTDDPLDLVEAVKVAGFA